MVIGLGAVETPSMGGFGKPVHSGSTRPR